MAPRGGNQQITVLTSDGKKKKKWQTEEKIQRLNEEQALDLSQHQGHSRQEKTWRKQREAPEPAALVLELPPCPTPHLPAGAA